MAFDPKEALDPTDWALLEALQQDARVSFAQLGRQLGLSSPAIAERVRRLEDRGVITGYHAAVNGAQLGKNLQVFVQAHVGPKDYAKFKALVGNLEDVLECYHLTGGESFLLRAGVESVEGLEDLIRRLSAFGETKTSLVLSTTVGRRVFSAPKDALVT